METFAGLTKYRVVNPGSVRRLFGIKCGMQEQDRIESIPRPSPRDLRGFLNGMRSEVHREQDRL